MNTSAENRKFSRVQVRIPVKFRKLQDGAGIEGIGSVSNNLSEGGIRFRTSEFVSMACRLILELDVPLVSKPIKAISKVVWIRKSDSRNEYEVGNRFLDMSKKDKEIISEYIASCTTDDVSSDSTADETSTYITEK